MNTRILYWWDQLRDKLWFIPSLMTFASFAVACLALLVDRAIEAGGSDVLPWLATTPASSRVVLGALISALVTVLGLAFSLTMLAVSQMASQYGPRLVRSVFEGNVTQNVMGLYLSTIVYCMVVLRSIRDLANDGDDFTPNLSLLIAEGLGGACLFGLLAFANHVTRCLRAEMLVAKIYRDALASIDELCQEESCEHSTDAVPDGEFYPQGDKSSRKANSLRSLQTGYLQAIELDLILKAATQRRERVELKVRPGDFVHEKGELATVMGESDDAFDEDPYQEVFLFGLIRTPRQDVESTIWELVEAGVRALSPGINDPVTAINVIDYLSAAMRKLAGAQWPGEYLTDDSGVARIRTKPFTFEKTLDAGFDQLRQYAGASVAVYCRLLEGLHAIGEVTECASRREAVLRQAGMVRDQAQRCIEEPRDQKDIDDRFQAVEELLKQPSI